MAYDSSFVTGPNHGPGSVVCVQDPIVLRIKLVLWGLEKMGVWWELWERGGNKKGIFGMEKGGKIIHSNIQWQNSTSVEDAKHKPTEWTGMRNGFSSRMDWLTRGRNNERKKEEWWKREKKRNILEGKLILMIDLGRPLKNWTFADCALYVHYHYVIRSFFHAEEEKKRGKRGENEGEKVRKILIQFWYKGWDR